MPHPSSSRRRRSDDFAVAEEAEEAVEGMEGGVMTIPRHGSRGAEPPLANSQCPR